MFAFGAVQTNITGSEQPKYSQSLGWGLLKSALDIRRRWNYKTNCDSASTMPGAGVEPARSFRSRGF